MFGSFEFKYTGARGAALAGAYTGLGDDAEAIWWNPAGIRLCQGIQLNSMYTGIYGMKELGYSSIAFVLPTMKAGTWGFGFSFFGPDEYRERDIRLSFATELDRGIYTGINLKKNQVELKSSLTKGTEKEDAFGVDMGLIANVNKKFSLGVSVLNINSPGFGQTSERIESIFLAGFKFCFDENITGCFDFQKSESQDIETRGGIELILDKNVFLRTGVQIKPSRFSFGLGYMWSVFCLDYAFITHSALNNQHLIGLKIDFYKSRLK